MALVILGPLNTATELAPDGLGLVLQFGVALTFSCLHLVSSSLFFSIQLQCLVLGGCWSQRSHFTSVRWPLLFKHQGDCGWVGVVRRVAMDKVPPPHARAVPGFTNFIGTYVQAHLLVMSLNVAKLTLKQCW